MSSPVHFDTVTDVDGDSVAILTYNDLVVLRSVERETGHVQEVFLDAALRARFAHAFAVAESQAEAHEASDG